MLWVYSNHHYFGILILIEGGGLLGVMPADWAFAVENLIHRANRFTTVKYSSIDIVLDLLLKWTFRLDIDWCKWDLTHSPVGDNSAYESDEYRVVFRLFRVVSLDEDPSKKVKHCQSEKCGWEKRRDKYGINDARSPSNIGFVSPAHTL